MTFPTGELKSPVAELAATPDRDWSLSICGVTRARRKTFCLVNRDAYAPITDRVRLLLVGGFSGKLADVAIALLALRYLGGGNRQSGIADSVIPCANPGGFALCTGPAIGTGG